MTYLVRVTRDGAYFGFTADNAHVAIGVGDYDVEIALRESLLGPEAVATFKGADKKTGADVVVILAKFPDLWDFPSVPPDVGVRVLSTKN